MKKLLQHFKKLFLLVIAIFLLLPVYGQFNYQEIVQNSESKKFDEIVREIENYFKDKDKGKGTGYNQFKRWEEFNRHRLTVDGRLINVVKIEIEEDRKYESTHPITKSNARTATANVSGNWTSIGPTNIVLIGAGSTGGIGRVNCVAVDPTNKNIIYVGTPAGGLWKSTDGGLSWMPLTDNIASLIGVSGIVIDPLSPVTNRTIYILTGDGDGGNSPSIGVLKSTNDGQTWNATGLSFATDNYITGFKLLIHPANNQTLMAIMTNGIYKTTDGGANWKVTLSDGMRDAEFNQGNPSILYSSSHGRVYKSTDTGDSWTIITSGLPSSSNKRIALGVTPANPNYVYALYGGVSKGKFEGLFRSTDGGLNFTQMSDSPNILGGAIDGSDERSQSWYDLAIAISPTNEKEVHVGGIDCWKSINEGSSWQNTGHWVRHEAGPGNFTHADIHALEFFGNTLYNGNDGGIFKSENHAEDWVDYSSGLGISQIYRIGADPSNVNRINFGAQDNGSNLLENGTNYHWLGGDGFETIITPNAPNIFYGSYQYGNLLKSTQSGGNLISITPANSKGGAWLTPYVMDPVNYNTLYAGYADIWKTLDAGTSWSNISNGQLGTAHSDHIAVTPSNSQYIYVSKGRDLFKTSNGGTTWSKVRTFNQYITYFAVNPTDPSMVWVTLGGFTKNEKIYKSKDGGSTWLNESGDLPNLPVNCIAYQKNTPNGLYIGTDMGVYYKNDNIPTWIPFSEGHPKTIVKELEINEGAKKIFSGTYGRGVWQSDLVADSQAPTTPTALTALDITTNSLTLSWTASQDNGGISGYDVFKDDVKLNINTITETTFKVSGLQPDSRHKYTVKAKDLTGNLSAPATVYGYTNLTSGIDLVITDLSWTPTNPIANEKVTFKALIKNIGTVATQSGISIDVKFYVGHGVVTWDESYTAALPSGYSATLTATMGWDDLSTWLASEGDHEITAIVDNNGIIAEGNETNNSASKTMKVGKFNKIYEAENAVLSGVTVQTSLIGYSGTGYGDYGNSAGEFIEWTVYATTAGNYTLEFANANNSIGRVKNIIINGTITHSNIFFKSTGIYPGWMPVSVNASLLKGVNIIKLISLGRGTNVDYLKIVSFESTLMPPPINLIASDITTNSFTLSWTSLDTNGITYDIFKDGVKINTSETTETSYRVTGLQPISSYSFTVKSKDGAGHLSDASTALRVTTSGAPGIDLIVTDISWSPTNPAANEAITFKATIKNQGIEATSPGTPIGVGFYVGYGLATWSNNYITSLPSGSVTSITANMGWDDLATWLATEGDHSISAIVDHEGAIEEGNETNNATSKNMKVGRYGKVYEAEEAVLSGVTVQTKIPGYSGTGYGDYGNSAGEYIEWTVNAPSAGNYILEFGNYNELANKLMNISINGTITHSDVVFKSTGLFRNWIPVSVNATLLKGNNIIRLISLARGPNVDYLKIIEMPGTPTQTIFGDNEPSINGNELSTNRSISFYPNPVKNGILNIALNSTVQSDIEITLLDFLSKTKFNETQQVVIGRNDLQLNLKSLSKGFYFLRITSKEISYIQRVILE